MKKFLPIFLLVAVMSVVSSCSKEKTEAPSYIQFDSKSYDLSVGILSDYGTNSNNLTYRSYSIILEDKETNPSVYVKFRIYSNSTTDLVAGTYTYSYADVKHNLFSYLYLGRGVVYDSKGYVTGKDLIFSESGSNVVEGSKIVISVNDKNNYVFDLFLNIKDTNGNTVAVTGQFSKVLTEY
jgi:hypothetical protein